MQEQHPLNLKETFTENDAQKKSRRRRGSRRRSSVVVEKEESPAFHSVVDIIHEMKRLPISDKQDDTTSWKRVRRHSEPAPQFKSRTEPIVFTNSFAALNSTPSPPLPERTRSQSVPNNIIPAMSQERRTLYPTHLPVCEASAAIRSNTLFSGILRVDAQDSSEAYVECEKLDASVYIFGSRNRNRALDGDQVAIELVDVNTMLYEQSSKKQARSTRRLSCLSTGSPVLASIPEGNVMSKPRPEYCGKVVSVLERPKNMLFSGTLSLYRPHTVDHQEKQDKPKIIWFVPADKRLPLVAVPIKHAPKNFVKYHEEYRNRIFVGSIQRWPTTSLHPFGLIVKEIGWMGELGVHSGALMADHHIKDSEFASGVLQEASSIKPMTDTDKKCRRDFTLEEIALFTVSDSTASDGDYAFSISTKEKDVVEIGIHVTDVSHYIRSNSSFEREARERSCAVSLVDQEIPIFPLNFIETHCSLAIPNITRLGFSVLCRFTVQGVLLNTWIGKSVIQSSGHINLSHGGGGAFKDDLDGLLEVCRQLRSTRKGSSMQESMQTFTLAESGYPEKVKRTLQTESSLLLQEVLIQANIGVGQKICSHFPDQALLYRQDPPKLDSLFVVKEYFHHDPLADSVSGLYQLIKEKETSTEKQEALLYLVRQCIPPSKYFSAGSLDITKYHHAEFGASMCTLFTNPLHNYGAITAQRQLCKALKGEQQEDTNFDMIDKIARHCNSAQLAKLSAEQDSRKLYTAAYIYRQCLDTEVKQAKMEALVVQLGSNQLLLYITKFGVEMPVSLNETSTSGAQHTYDSTLNQVRLVWETKEKVISFLSSLTISIYVDMKAVQPVIEIQIL